MSVFSDPGRSVSESKKLRFVGFLEVVDVADVGRNRTVGGLFVQEVLHNELTTGPGGAQGKDIVAVVPHSHSESHRFDSAGLSDDFYAILDIRRRLEVERRWIRTRVKCFGLEFFWNTHPFPPFPLSVYQVGK